MKITSTNQTLLLAGEGRGSGNPDSPVSISAASTGSTLQRVTIVASQPDATLLYLQADYSPQSGGNVSAAVTDGGRARSGGTGSGAGTPVSSALSRFLSQDTSQSTALVAQSQYPTQRDAYGNVLTSRDTGISSYLRPEEQYAQTQRLLTDTPQRQQIDVHA